MIIWLIILSITLIVGFYIAIKAVAGQKEVLERVRINLKDGMLTSKEIAVKSEAILSKRIEAHCATTDEKLVAMENRIAEIEAYIQSETELYLIKEEAEELINRVEKFKIKAQDLNSRRLMRLCNTSREKEQDKDMNQALPKKKIYFPHPDSNGGFSNAIGKTEPGSLTYYELQVDSGQPLNATYTLMNAAIIEQFMGANPQYLRKGCDIQGTVAVDKTIKRLKPGIAELQGNYWVIIQKALIEYV